MMFLEKCRMRERTDCDIAASQLVTHKGSTKAISVTSLEKRHEYQYNQELTQRMHILSLIGHTSLLPRLPT
jgi:hypothetical protein